MLKKSDMRRRIMSRHVNSLEANGIEKVSFLLEDGAFTCVFDIENQKIGHIVSDGVIYFEIIRSMTEDTKLYLVGKNINGYNFVLKYSNDKLMESISDYHAQLVYEYQAMSILLYSGMEQEEIEQIMDAEELSIEKLCKLKKR